MAHRRPAGGASSVTDNENAIRLLESLQNDFKCLSMETKKKYPQIKEVSASGPGCVVLAVASGRFKFPCHLRLFVQASEEAIVKLRNSAAVAADHLQQKQQSQHHHHQIYYVVNQILYPVVQGCETKDPKIVKVHIVIISSLLPPPLQIMFVIYLPMCVFLVAL